MIGYSMITFIFTAFFYYLWKQLGFKEALLTYTFTVVTVGFILLAVYLIGRGI